MEDKLKILDESLNYFFDKKVVLFVGAGISRIAGCYDWNSVIKNLLNDDNLFKDIDKGDFIKSRERNNVKIQFLKNRYINEGKEKKFFAILREAITPDPKLYYKDYIPFIKSLRNINPFPIILTTNVDSCIEDSGQLGYEKIYYEINDFVIENLQEGSIFHLHGYKENFLSSLFSYEEYRNYYEKKSFKEFVNYVFTNYCIIFIGYSLSDDELRQLLNIFNKKNRIKNYILVPENEFSETDIAVNKELYDLYTIEYGKVDNFPEIFSSWIAKNFKVEPIGSVKSFSTSSGRSVK